jgi:hypothetical protein
MSSPFQKMKNKLNPVTPIATGNPRDGLGRELQVGDAVFLKTGQEPIFRVSDIHPAVNPNLPPGMLQIDMICYVPMLAPAGKPTPDIVRVATAEEAGPLNIKKTEDREEEKKVIE